MFIEFVCDKWLRGTVPFHKYCCSESLLLIKTKRLNSYLLHSRNLKFLPIRFRLTTPKVLSYINFVSKMRSYRNGFEKGFSHIGIFILSIPPRSTLWVKRGANLSIGGIFYYFLSIPKLIGMAIIITFKVITPSSSKWLGSTV